MVQIAATLWANRLRQLVAMGYDKRRFDIYLLQQQTSGTIMDKATKTKLEAAAFRRLVAHLQERTDVQNIDMMNLSGFCRNCMSRWYRQAAETSDIEMTDNEARKLIYGMEYADWKAQYQTEATPEQKAQYLKTHNHDD